ncbi:unnamed protein product [Timema podura]|uniref:RRM domain-containing protein n=1 Tax=Timema podura TaxID=61482 RepID=A0ABN7NM75_TIMPD|nr:unnamed protein product [Timema podura]
MTLAKPSVEGLKLAKGAQRNPDKVLNRSMDPKTYEQPQPLIAQIPQVPLLPQHIITSGTRKDCIRLRGLPYEAQVEHILEFLGDYAKSIVFQGVHMVYNAQGQPSGEAFIQMDSEQSAFMTAQNKHHRYMFFGKKQRYIEVFQCSGEDMNLVLTGGIPTTPGAVSPAKAATLLSPGMLTAPPPPPPGHPPPTFHWEHPFMQAQMVVAQQAHQAQAMAQAQSLAMRQSQANEGIWFMNQLVAAHHQQAAMAVALAAAASNNNLPKQISWGEMNGTSNVSSGHHTSSTVSVSLANTSKPPPPKTVAINCGDGVENEARGLYTVTHTNSPVAMLRLIASSPHFTCGPRERGYTKQRQPNLASTLHRQKRPSKKQFKTSLTGLHRINVILKSDYKLLANFTQTQNLLSSPPRVAFKHPPNLHNILVHLLNFLTPREFEKKNKLPKDHTPLGGTLMPPPPFGPAATFAQFGHTPTQLIPAAPPLAARHTFPVAYPPIFYWPYPSPPVSPTSYYGGPMPAALGPPQGPMQPPQPTLVIMQGLPYSANVGHVLNFFSGSPEVRGYKPAAISRG